jgi:hypothetical protein
MKPYQPLVFKRLFVAKRLPQARLPAPLDRPLASIVRPEPWISKIV